MRLLLLVLLAAVPALRASVPDHLVRPEILNQLGPATPAGSGVYFSNGLIANGTHNDPPASAGVELREASFGQAFGSNLSPNSVYSEAVRASVFAALYPDGYGTPGGVTANRAAILAGSNAFRSKFLMFGEDPSSGEILNVYDTADSSGWFTEADRDVIREQIGVLREALAIDPYNRELQDLLLDVHYDWAVAEMQLARGILVGLSKVRLGITATGDFIIDDEIAACVELVELTDRVLGIYRDLFSFQAEGVNPSDFYASSIRETGEDPSGSAPFGYYLFRTRVPYRAEQPTQYADATGVRELSGDVFDGFKDYRTLLTVLGQHIQCQAELARLRGLRKAISDEGDDLTLARQGLTAAQEQAGNACLLAQMFREYDFELPEFDGTGVRAARISIVTGLEDVASVRTFLNGSSNVLGLDPNFLLLLPPEPNNNLFDSYDLLVTKLTATSGGLPVGPLAVALDELDTAIDAYENFRESGDRVSTELSGLEDEFAERFVEITGFDYETEGDQWDGIHWKEGVPSELATAERAIDSFQRRNGILTQTTAQLQQDLRNAQAAVALAQGTVQAIADTKYRYFDNTAAAYREIHVWAGVATASQALTDTAFALSGIDGVTTLGSAGTNVAIAGVAGATNMYIQTAAAVRTSMREQQIDDAAITFDAELAAIEAPLTVKQTMVELGSLLREQHANALESEDNSNAMAQAIADKAALLREVQRAENNLRADRAALAGKYYADPIHFIRSERALLRADAAFRTAQRWVFFTARALEYKWQERFSYVDAGLGLTYDTGTILKARNADELATVVQKMAQWDLDRTGTPTSIVTVISVRDQFVTPNPDDINLDFSPLLVDAGVRHDPATKSMVDKLERFRQILTEHADGAGNIVIPFDTTLLENFGSNFFAGPDFSDPGNPESGFYRDKIDWVAVNLVATDGVTPPNLNGRSGRLTYGGNTFFRTRVPVYPDRSVAATVSASDSFSPDKDFGSEFVVAPFRFYQDTAFTGVFELFDVQNVGSMKFAYSADSANDPAVLARLTDTGFGFRRNDLKERSVAATRWQLRINTGQVDLSRLEDIELVIQHIAYPRPQIAPN